MAQLDKKSVAQGPKVEITELTDRRLSFRVRGITEKHANVLRRVLLKDVPTMSVSYSRFKTNTSTAPDEWILRRLEMMPLKSTTAVRKYVDTVECTCETQCEKCSVTFTLDVKNDVKAETDLEVLAGSLKSSDPAVVPVDPQVQILKLAPGAEISMQATAVLGTGEKDVHWKPGHAYYKHFPRVEVAVEGLTLPEKQELVKTCPVKVFELDSAGSVQVARPEDCYYCKECTKWAHMNSHPGAVTVKEKDDDFLFHVESEGALEPLDIVKTAFQVYDQHLARLSQEIAKL